MIEIGTQLKNVNYRYDENYIYIDVKDRQYSLFNVVKFIYLLGIDDTHNYDEFKDPDGYSPSGLSTYDSFLYQAEEEINGIKFNFNDQNRIVNIIGNLLYSDFNFDYSTEDMGHFEIHVLPYTNNIKYIDLTRFKDEITETTLIEENIRVLTTQKNASISKKGFTNEGIDVNCILKKVINTRTGEEETFSSYSWDKHNINISFNNEIENDICSFEFLIISVEISRDYLGIKKDKSERPNSYVGSLMGHDTFSESNTIYYYIWDADKLTIYFMESPELNKAKIKIINFFNIYQFKVFPLNYFTKSLTIDVNVYNYDDEFLPIYAPGGYSNYYDSSIGDYVEKEIRGEKHPLYWETLNLYKYSDKHGKYILDKSKCESSKYGYQKTSFTNTNGDYSSDQFHVSMNPTFDDIQGNGKYKTNVITKFLKNNMYKIISLYNDDDYSESKTIVNDDDQVITYNVLYPYVNFFGNFKDAEGKGYSNEYIYKINSKGNSEYYYDDYNRYNYFPIFSYKVTLVNADPALSADLSYEYKCPEVDKKYGYTYYKLDGYYYYWGTAYPQYSINSNGSYYQFMFKHGPFTSPDSYYDGMMTSYNPYLESIYPGTYNLKVSLFKIIPGQNGQDNSSIYAKYDEENPEVYDFGNIELTKEVEATSGLYNYNLEIPFISVSGKVINEADNSLVYGQDLVVEFINKNDVTKSRKFSYDCAMLTSYNADHNWRNKDNRFNQSFLFKLFGLQKKYGPEENFDFITDGGGEFPTNNEEKHYEPGIPSGIYDIKVYYKNILFDKIDNFEITKEKALNGELSSLVFKSPLIDIDGKIVDNNGNILEGDNWSVLINDGNNTIRKYRYAYSLNEDNMMYRITNESSFKFKNLPIYSCYDIYADLRERGEIWWDGYRGSWRFPNDDSWYWWEMTPNYTNYLNGTRTSEFLEERKTRYAIPSGTYELIVKYKNKIIKTFTKTFTKAEESTGAYKNINLNVGNVLKDFNIQFIDSQTSEPAQMVEFRDRGNSTRNYKAWLRIYDEDYDGDITDDQFNTTNWGTDETENTYTFDNQFVGYYRMKLYCRDVGDNSNTPKILNIVDSETNDSIYEKKEETGAQFDLINLGSDLVSSEKTYNVLLDYWFGGLYFTVNKKNNDQRLGISGYLISVEFEHQNIDNLKYSSSGSLAGDIKPIKTGNYIGKSYLNLPNGTSYLLAEPTPITIKQYHDFVFKSKYSSKVVKFAFYGKIGETADKIYKLPNLRYERMYFSDTLNGSRWTYSYDGYFGESYRGTKTIEIDHLLDGLNLYYSFGNVSTYPYTGYSGGSYYGAWKGDVNIIKLYKLTNNEYDRDEEKNKLMNSSSIDINEIENSYVNILENGKFKVEDLEENGTYIALTDGFYINVTLQVRDSRGNNSSLCYNISIYNENGEWFSGNNSNTGSISFDYIPAGRYKIYIDYNGIEITPSYLKNKYQDWYEYGTYYIDLEFPLQTFTGNLVYPNENGTLINSYAPLAVTVTKLRKLDNTPAFVNDSFYDDCDEFTYYFANRYTNSNNNDRMGMAIFIIKTNKCMDIYI